MARTNGISTSLIALVIVAIGAGSASTWLKKSTPAGPPPAPLAISPKVASATTLTNSQAYQIEPTANLRPLGVLASAISSQPLFSLNSQGSPVLSGDFAAAGQDLDCAAHEPLRDACAVTKMLKKKIGNGHVSVLIATLPDWVDSNLQWTFDPILDAIQMSAAQMGYVLVGFDMVDKEPDGSSTATKGAWTYPRLHELTPGTLLFRQVAQEPGSEPEYLLVLMVGETVTGGILPVSFASALDLALLWEPPLPSLEATPGLPVHHKNPIRILGPLYSGSVVSLTQGMKAAAQRHGLVNDGKPWFDVISGSASNPDNHAKIEGEGWAVFRATVRSDTDEILAIERYLGRSNRGWQCGVNVALLVEANTTWGRGVAKSVAGGSCSQCMENPGEFKDPLPCAAVLPFPLHIARLRDAAANQSPPSKPINNSSVVSLDLAEKSPPVDLVPPESPDLTAASVEIMMSELFRALQDRSITAVGVFATDKRDHVYLAEEIARRRPNVLPFTIESSVTYLHPDVVGYLRGTLIASTYSLADRTQRLTAPVAGQLAPQQFASSPAHGVFNALVTLMGHPEKLVDYARPAGLAPQGVPSASAACGGESSAASDCAPPIWISVVGRSAILPLDAISPTPCRTSASSSPNYVMCRPDIGTTPAKADATGNAPFGHGIGYLTARRLFMVTVTAMLLLMLGYQVWVQRRIEALPDTATPAADLRGRDWLRAIWSASLSFFRWPRRFDPVSIEVQAALVAFRGATLLVFCWWWKLALIYLGDRYGIASRVLQWVFCPVAALITLYIVCFTIETFFPITSEGRKLRRLHLGLLALAVFFVVSGLSLPLWPAFTLHQKMLDFGWLVTAGAFIVLDFAPRKGEVPSPLTRWRRFPVLLGLAAFISFVLDLSVLNWGPITSLAYADRNASIEDLVSPAYSIALFAAAVFWWGVWNVRRIELLQLPEGRVGIGRLLVGRARAAGLDPEVFRAPILSVGLYIGLPTLSAVIALWFGRPHVGTIDGRYFSAFLLFGGVLITTILLHALLHSAHLSSAVTKLLDAVGRHPGASLFKRLGAERFSWQIAYRDSNRSELEPVLVYVERLLACLPQSGEADEAILPGEKDIGDRIRRECTATLEHLRLKKLSEFTDSRLTFEDWQALDHLTVTLDRVLEQQVWRRAAVDPSTPDYLKNAFDDMQYIVFFHTALVLRDLLARLVSGFTMIIGGLFILVMAHLFSTFEGRVFWLCFDSAAVSVSVVIALYYMLTLERDPVLSSLWRTAPGRISLFGGLTWRMVGYAVVSLVTLFAVSFPELAGRAVDWLAPARAVLGE